MKMLLTLRELESLADGQEPPALSIYLPTVQSGRETRQNRIRFKNLLGEAEQLLKREGVRAPRARELLQPLRRLTQDETFWLHQQSGLAVFQSPSHGRLYRLPISFAETVVTGTRFYLKPLFRLLQGDGRFLLLALGQHGTRLFQATRHQLEELETPEVPESVLAALQSDTPQASRQQAAQSTPGRGAPRAGSSQPPISFGMGEEVGDRRESLLQYFHAVDHGLHEVLRDERVPLLVAGLDHLVPLYREAATYPHVLEEAIVTNPAALSLEELHRQAWEKVGPRFGAERDRQAEVYRQRAGTARAGDDPARLLPAAADGRVETLWVAADAKLWGRYDRQARSVETARDPRPGDEDLLDTAAALTLLHGGTVYVEEQEILPGEGVCAALFRW